MKQKLQGGASDDAILLTGIKLVTVVIGLVITRLLSPYLSVHDYGTYTQAMLIVSTVNTLTILGMIDGVNFFYCSEQDTQKREAYVATIFAMQSIVCAIAGCLVMLLSGQICHHFENPELKKLLIFSAALPLPINLVSMLQVLLVSVGRAKLLALRNLTVSIVRLLVVLLVTFVVNNIAIILLTTLLLDIAQVFLFGWLLHQSGCRIPLKSVNLTLVKRIAYYCAPMGVFTAISALNRDMDKYLIAFAEDTEMLAMYANASKILPFDIIVASFSTVLTPQITKLIAQENKPKAAQLYKTFLEISYISTFILCGAALVASPQLMKLLYSDKYMGGLSIFRVYILVDLLRFTNITMILAAAGKTTKLMVLSTVTLVVNAVLNLVLYSVLGIIGPAIATLLATLLLGFAILNAGAKELDTKLYKLFDIKYLLLLLLEGSVLALLLLPLRQWLARRDVYYMVILFIIGGLFGVLMLLMNAKRILRDLKYMNTSTKNTQREEE